MASSKKGDARFFTTNKKGSEIQELKNDLNCADKNKVISAVKRVIASMTIGKDVSPLFSELVKCMQTDNLELKKLIYLYVINYAREIPDQAVLVQATFINDARSPNPLIRALAIRTMGCVRVDKIIGSLCETLPEALKDKDPYVRKTAAICVSKMFIMKPDLVQKHGYLDTLRDLIGDDNPMVVSNTVAALAEISETSGVDVIKIDQVILQKLLLALNECAEWGAVLILDCLSKYEPGPDDAAQIIERVSPRLKHSNTAVALSAVKVLMKYLKYVEDPEVERQLVTEKLPQPLITLLSHAQPEIQYVALRNINLICQRNPAVLSAGINHFFCKYNDPIYVKVEKLEIMIQLADEKNIDRALMEFKEYATEVDVAFVRRSVRAIGRCAIKIGKATERCIKVLIDLIQTKVNYVVQEAIIVIRDIFRKYPNKYLSIIGTLCENLDTLDEPEAKAAMVWIIGEYANHIDKSPELLEMFVDSFENDSSEVQLQCLTAVVKLFLRRPDEGKEMVQKVLHLATDKSDNPDLRDRGFVYWRLLSSDPDTAQSVVLSKKPKISDDTYQLDPTVLDVLIGNLNTLASIYHQPPEFFTAGAKASIVLKPTIARKGRARHESEDSGTTETDESSEDSKESKGHNDEDSSSSSSSRSSKSTSSSSTGSESSNSSDENGEEGATRKKIVMTEKQGKGLQVKNQWVRRNGQLMMDLTFENKSKQQLSNMQIKFNKNFLGINPGISKLPVSLPPGGSADFMLPITTTHQIGDNAKAGVIQMAVKNDIGVVYFQDKLSAYMLFEEDGLLEKRAWLEKWKELPDTSEQQITIENRVYKSAEDILERFSASNVFHIATRQLENKKLLYHSIKYKGLSLLLEVKISGRECSASMRADKTSYLPTALVGIKELLQT